MRKIETKKLAAAVTALALCAGVLTGCGGAASGTASSTAASSASSEASSEEADEMAAKNVADLIDAIYVQERNDDTDAQCEAAKAAWDALTDTQKELVEGENADPDYFGRDTGDASKDSARNEDNIGENELLVVSFGTSFNDSRVKDIKGIEDALQAAYPDWSVRRAFTAQIIINHVQARDGEKIDNMQQAMDRAVANGVKNLIVQPTHLMHGAEYDEMMEMIDSYRDKFESVAVAEPLLGEVGSDATVINSDKEVVAKAVTEAAVKDAGYESLDAAAAEALLQAQLRKALEEALGQGEILTTRCETTQEGDRLFVTLTAHCFEDIAKEVPMTADEIAQIQAAPEPPPTEEKPAKE